jgi:PKD repeat protein
MGAGFVPRPNQQSQAKETDMFTRKLTRSAIALLMVAALALPGASIALAAPPANDNFAAATVVPGLPFSDVVDNTEATEEAGEPQYCYSPQTVWYTFTPSANVAVRADMAGSSFSETVLTVYESTGGGLGGLSFVGCATWGSSLTFSAEAGKTYYLQAGNIYPPGGALQLNLEEVPPPANDNFAAAVAIGSLPFNHDVDTTGATRETGEPISTCAQYNTPLSGTVWYTFTPAAGGSVSAQMLNASISPMIAAYTGSGLGGLTELGCRNWDRLTIQAEVGATYFFQVSGLYGQGGPLQFNLEVTPPPIAQIGLYPSDPSVFDVVQFYDNSYDPGNLGIQSQTWDFGDGATATGCCPTHHYAADGDYTVQLAVTTPDGRSASTVQTIGVRTHDVAIVRITAPKSARVGRTSRIGIDLRNNRYPETVEVQLFKSTPGGYQFVGTLIQFVPARTGNRTTRLNLSYTFTNDDAVMGKVTFRAIVNIQNARDALSADNEAISSPPTKVNR